MQESYCQTTTGRVELSGRSDLFLFLGPIPFSRVRQCPLCRRSSLLLLRRRRGRRRRRRRRCRGLGATPTRGHCARLPDCPICPFLPAWVPGGLGNVAVEKGSEGHLKAHSCCAAVDSFSTPFPSFFLFSFPRFSFSFSSSIIDRRPLPRPFGLGNIPPQKHLFFCVFVCVYVVFFKLTLMYCMCMCEYMYVSIYIYIYI